MLQIDRLPQTKKVYGADVPPLHFLSYQEMKAMPAPNWLVPGVLMEKTAALLFGKSNAFKTFLGLDIAGSIATGRPWHGKPVAQGRVLYVATEGANGVGRLRVPVWMDHHRIPEDERNGIFLFPKEVALDTPEQVDALVKSINHEAHGRGFALIVVDIFGGSMSGSEVKDETARAWVHGVQRIIRDCGVTVLTIAHTGWADETRARMHTHFWGSFDTRLKAEGDKDARTTVLSVDRHKDADSSGQWGFRLDIAGPVGESSLVPVLDEAIKPKAAGGRSVKGQALIALQALDEALVEKGRTRTSANLPSCPVVEMAVWEDYAFRHGLSDSPKADTRSKAWKRAKEALMEKDQIRVFDGFVWRATRS